MTFSSFSTIRGTNIDGSISDLFESDDSYLSYNPGFTLNSTEPPVWVEFKNRLASSALPSLSLCLEANAGTPGLTQQLLAFNFDSNSFDLMDSRNASFGFDSVTTVSLDPALHVDLSTGDVVAQATWRQAGFVINFPWEVGIDQVVWDY